jgi:hypothetical protein
MITLALPNTFNYMENGRHTCFHINMLAIDVPISNNLNVFPQPVVLNISVQYNMSCQ